MTKLSDITSPNWSLSVEAQGVVVEGVDEISQCILIIVKTQKGSDPLRPDFGCDIFAWIDKPAQSESVPKMIKALTDAIAIWEPRVNVDKVDFEVIVGGITFSIQWSEKVTGTTGTTNITVNGAT